MKLKYKKGEHIETLHLPKICWFIVNNLPSLRTKQLIVGASERLREFTFHPATVAPAPPSLPQQQQKSISHELLIRLAQHVS